MRFASMIVCAAVVAVSASAQDTHPFAVQDMLAMERISDPRVSPDARWISFTVRVTDVEANKGRTDIWLVGIDGSNARRLTTHAANDMNARWLDTRTLAFLSTRGGSSQVWTMPIDGGEPQPLTTFALDVENMDVFPGGKKLLLSFDVWPQAKTLAESAELDAKEAKRRTSAKVYESLMFRHWDSWEDHKRSHLFAWELGSAAPLDLMPGLDCDAPTKPFGGLEETSISPDGATVAFVMRNVGREDAWSTNSDVYVVPADGGAPPVSVTSDNAGYDVGPSYSPDGKTLAYLSMPRAGYEADRQQIVLLDVAGGAKKRLAADWDRSAGEITWSSDGATIFTSAANVGNSSIFAVDVAAGTVKTLVDKGNNVGVLSAGAVLVFQRDTLKAPVELYAVSPEGGEVRALTKVNAAKLATTRMGDAPMGNKP